VALDANVTLTFAENVVLGASGDIVVSDGSDTQTIDVSSHAGQLTVSSNTVTLDPTADLANNSSNYNVQVDNGAITDLAGNAYAGIADTTTLDFTTEAGPDTSIVVFDLIGGDSSSHSGRTFDSSVSYTIYVRVDSFAGFLTPAPTWAGGANLGSDDSIVLVGNGSPVIGGSTGPVSNLVQNNGNNYWSTASLTAAWQQASGKFNRSAPSGSSATRIWNGNASANFNVGATLGEAYTTTMPAGVMTSQGL
jgi:hypothetical protein